MVVAITVLVGSDMGILQPDLATAYQRIGTTQVDMTFANRLNLGTKQRDACLDGTLDGVVVISLSVDRDDFDWHMIGWCLWGCFCHTKTPLRTCICWLYNQRT